MGDLIHKTEPQPFLSALVYFCVALLGFVVVGPLVGFGLVSIFFDYTDVVKAIAMPLDYPDMKGVWLFIQSCSTLVGMVLVPIVFFKYAKGVRVSSLFTMPTRLNVLSSMTFLIVISFLAPLSVIIQWNDQVVLPEFMNGFYHWARAVEDNAALVTKFITHFESPFMFVVGLISIAIFPALGEELVFRGLIQRTLSKGFNNPHLAIWVSALLFSLVHMQFFGLIPRMLLGALFGYLYFWSQNLWVPILGHFFHNGLAVTMVYLKQINWITYDVESKESAPWPSVLFFLFVFIALLWAFNKITTPIRERNH